MKGVAVWNETRLAGTIAAEDNALVAVLLDVLTRTETDFLLKIGTIEILRDLVGGDDFNRRALTRTKSRIFSPCLPKLRRTHEEDLRLFGQ